MISEPLRKLISEQVGLELRAERFYLLAANLAAKLGFDTFSEWLRCESHDEAKHSRHWTKLAEDMGVLIEAELGPQDTQPATLEATIQEAVQLEMLLLTHMNSIFIVALAETCTPVLAFLFNGRKGYRPVTHQQKSISEWQQMADRLKTQNIADIEAALTH